MRLNGTNDNGYSQGKEIIVQSIDPADRADVLEYEEAGASMNCSFIPKPSNYQQLQVMQETNANSFHSNSKNFFVAPRGASIGAEARSSPPKTMIGSGIGQGFNFQRGFTLRPAHQNDAGHKHTNSGSNVPVSQINLNSSQPPSLTP